MVYIEKFLGKQVKIPEHLRYVMRSGLWAERRAPEIAFGLTEPALVLSGGLTELDWIVSEGEEVQQGEPVLFAITGKILYIDSPLAGVIHLNPQVKATPALLSEDPYGQGWLFKIKPRTQIDNAYEEFASVQDYVKGLQSSEGGKNPQGLKGGVSGMCKAVYSAIREQKLTTS